MTRTQVLPVGVWSVARADVPHDGSADLTVWPASLVELELAAGGLVDDLVAVCGSTERATAIRAERLVTA